MSIGRQEDVFKRLNELGINVVTHSHPPLFTVEESKELRGPLPGGHCKNLFLRDKKGKMWLLICREDLTIELKSMSIKLGSGRLSFGSADRLKRVLGVFPGAVSPFALINDIQVSVEVIIDQGLMTLSPLNFHPITNDKTTAIKPADLISYIKSCGHEPKIMNMDSKN